MKNYLKLLFLLSSIPLFSQSVDWTTEGCTWENIYSYRTNSIDELVIGLASKGWTIDTKTDSILFVSRTVQLAKNACVSDETALQRIATEPNSVHLRVDWRPLEYRTTLISSLIFNEYAAIVSSGVAGASFSAKDFSMFQLPLYKATWPEHKNPSRLKSNLLWLECLGKELGNLLSIENTRLSTW